MNHIQGRAALQAWEASKPTNYYLADPFLQQTLAYYLGDAYEAALDRLRTLGAQSAQVIDPLVRQEDRIGNHPQLERYTGIGERIEQIAFHPNHDAVGRIIWEAGLMALQAKPGSIVLQMGLYYLLALNGEAGHLCSLACTSGLIRALQTVGDVTLQAEYLPPLLETDYARMHHGAQFLTEVQGGSDVGANSVRAEQAADGTWRISGEKWFCSNVNADQFLMTARASDASGTRGLGLFLVPRRLHDGSTNRFFIRRLKDKLGTRTLASAELDFDGAVAYAVGPIEQGFKNAVELVLNTSRLMNAVACAGIMRRAFYEASTYACHRSAFGSLIASYPLVQEAVADLVSEASAATASSFYLAHLVDRMDTHQASDDERAIYRLLVNVNKYLTSVRGSEMTHRAIEVLGGNGAIESFSVLPRLYRDMVVLESWEGTHNVLALQVLRDIARYRLHEPFTAAVRGWLRESDLPALSEERGWVAQAVSGLEQMLARLMQGTEAYQQAHARRLIDRIGLTAQAALLLRHCQHAPTRHNIDATAHFVRRHLHAAYDPMLDEDYLPRLERLTLS
jgi:acyl-CoA dehydrogenase